MQRRKFLGFLPAFAALGAAVPASAQAKAHRVLFALTSAEDADWQLTAGNTSNLLKALDPEPVDVEIVFYGPSISLLKADSSAAAAIKDLMAKKVQFMACANAMRFHKIAKEDLVPGSVVVPAGIAEVVKKCEAGWTYIHAGR